MKKTRRGFTLPEILVTVTVVAVLAAVVVPTVTQFANKGDAPTTQSELQNIMTAVTSYVADTRAYPSTLADLITAPSPAVSGWNGPYLSTTQTVGAASGTVGVYYDPTGATSTTSTTSGGALTAQGTAGQYSLNGLTGVTLAEEFTCGSGSTAHFLRLEVISNPNATTLSKALPSGASYTAPFINMMAAPGKCT